MLKKISIFGIMSVSLWGSCNKNIINKLKKERISIEAYKQALTYYQKNKFDDKYITFIDFTLPSDKKRMYIIDNENEKIYKYKTAHGGGYKHKFNKLTLDICEYKGNDKNFTRPGFYQTIGIYESKLGKKYHWKNFYKHFNGIKMRGLSKGVNGDIYDKGVVIHSSSRVTERNARNSSGCFSVSYADIKSVASKIKFNNMVYAYVPQCKKEMDLIKQQIIGWERICETYDYDFKQF
jgi:hypothetical protein